MSHSLFSHRKIPTLFFSMALPCFVGSACTLSSAATMVLAPCNTGSCFRQYLCRLGECNDNFNNDTYPNNKYLNNDAWNQCQDGASIHRAACRDDPTNNNFALRAAFWVEFLDNLKTCIDMFGENSDDPAANPENLKECIEEALADYRQRIANTPPVSEPDSCSGQQFPQGNYNSMYLGEMNALQLAAIQLGNPDGKYPVKVNTSMGVTAGVNISASGSYDASQIPCIKSAIAIAIYQTKAGTAIVPIDADLDTSDGTHFDIMFFGNKLIDAKDVTILTVFFDQDDKPVFGERGEFEIEQSPITGDWNRDQVLNTQDITDFLDSYSAQTKRSDINNDGQVTPADASQFANP